MLSTSAWSLQPSLISAATDGANGGNEYSATPILSGNGRYILFTSLASNLVANDTNNSTDVFLRDLQTNMTTLVSVNAAGTASGNGASVWPSISDNGRYIAFVSHASDLTALDEGYIPDVFVRDMVAATTSLVSVNTSGNGGSNNVCFTTAISGDGSVIAFESVATNLVNNPDTVGTNDTFARDLDTGTTSLLTITTNGTAAGGESLTEPSLSFDGNIIVFSSSAGTLVSNDGNAGYRDIFAHNLATGTTTLVTINRFGNGSAMGQSERGYLSANGRDVAFESCAQDLSPLNNNGACSVYVRDLVDQTTTLIGVSTSGTSGGNGGAGLGRGRVISDDGNLVAFHSTANNLVSTPDSNGANDVFVRNLSAGTTQLVSINRTGMATGNSSSYVLELSGSGNRIIFESSATDLVANDTSPVQDVFIHDLQSQVTTLASTATNGASGGNDFSHSAVLSDDGAIAAFNTRASNLSVIDTNNVLDVYAVDFSGAMEFHITGQIRTSTLTPIAGATMQLSTTSGPVGSPIVSAVNGYYEFRNIAPGDYTITVSKPGFSFTPTSQTLRVTSANRAANFTGRYITPTFSLTGRISDPKGNAVPGAVVVLSPAPSGVTASIVSNSAGYFVFHSVPDGNYTVTPSKTGYRFVPSARQVTVNGASQSGLNFIGHTGYTVTGRISHSNGTAIAGATVQLDHSLTTTTNSAGYYTFYNVSNGSHSLTPSKSGYSFMPVRKAIIVQEANLGSQNFIGSNS